MAESSPEAGEVLSRSTGEIGPEYPFVLTALLIDDRVSSGNALIVKLRIA